VARDVRRRRVVDWRMVVGRETVGYMCSFIFERDFGSCRE